MRSLSVFLILLAVVAIPVCAQTDVSDERPPSLDDSVPPEVTIIQHEGGTVEEYRVSGRLYKVKVIPSRGEPYILIDYRGDGSFIRHEGPGTPGLSVPQWVIGTF